jgi:hypothetical protein
MKQIAKTPSILARLRKAVGADVPVQNHAVYESIALNTLPIRKRHPLYKGAVAERSLLLEMAARVDQESVPLQIMHDGDVLPIGRAFYGEVVEKGSQTELRTLFFVDPANADKSALIDNGTVDQVSVAILPKKIECSACGFDFIGPEATFENVYTRTCPNGHVLDQNGVHARLVGLDQWNELSLVGIGGAQNARIVNQDQSHFSQNLQRLAASGADLDQFILTATAETEDNTMDAAAFIASLTEKTEALTTANLALTNANAQVAALTTERDALQARITELGEPATALAAANESLATKDAELTAATTALQDILKKILIASGNVDPQPPATVPELVAQISEKSTSLSAMLTAGGKSQGADGAGAKPKAGVSPAFRVTK